MNSEREKADILFDYGLPLQFCCHLIQFYTLLFLRVATLMILIFTEEPYMCSLSKAFGKIRSSFVELSQQEAMTSLAKSN